MNQNTIQIPAWLTFLVPAVALLIGIILERILDYFWGTKKQLKLEKHQQRQQVFSELMGISFMLQQLYVSRYEALVNSIYHERIWMFTHKLKHHSTLGKDSISYREFQRWGKKNEDLLLKIAECRERLFKTVGLIIVLFPNIISYNKNIAPISHMDPPGIRRSDQLKNREEIEMWRTNELDRIKNYIDNDFISPIQNLVTLLQQDLLKK